MVRLVPDFIARRRAAARERRVAESEARVAAYNAERYRTETHIEPDAARGWKVTASLRLDREDDYRHTRIELQPGTSLKYEYTDYQNGHDGGGWSSANRRFLVLDGEYAGARVTHGEMSHRSDDGEWTEPPEMFPPAGLQAKAPASDLREDQPELTGLTILEPAIARLTEAELIDLGACRRHEENARSDQTKLAATIVASVVTQAEKQEASRLADLALRHLSGPADAIIFAAHDILIGPALVALNLTALAVIARDRIDRETYETLTRPWREAFGGSTGQDAVGDTNRRKA